jgi:hypothetical protein
MLSRLFKTAVTQIAVNRSVALAQIAVNRSVALAQIARVKLHIAAAAPIPYQNRLFRSYLTKQQPYQPHTVPFLDLQMSAMQEKYQYPKNSLLKTTLKKGQKLKGLTGNLGLVYGGVPLYQDNTLLSMSEVKEIAHTISKLGCHWVEYTINADIECIVHTTKQGNKRWFVSDDFLDIEKKPTSVLRF